MTEETYNEYMKRLDAEYDEFRITVSAYSVDDIMEKAAEIYQICRARDYLRFCDVPDDSLSYVMTAMYPLHEVAAVCRDLDESATADHYVVDAVKRIFDSRLFDNPSTLKYTNRVPICFHRKIGSLDEILRLPRNREDDRFVVEKIVELSTADFDRFASNLLSPMLFLPYGDDRFQVLNDGAWHCLLVHDAEKNRGMLVDSSGYDYARYAAFVQDTRELDFQNIPVEKCTLPSPKRVHKPKRQER